MEQEKTLYLILNKIQKSKDFNLIIFNEFIKWFNKTIQSITYFENKKVLAFIYEILEQAYESQKNIIGGKRISICKIILTVAERIDHKSGRCNSDKNIELCDNGSLIDCKKNQTLDNNLLNKNKSSYCRNDKKRRTKVIDLIEKTNFIIEDRGYCDIFCFVQKNFFTYVGDLLLDTTDYSLILMKEIVRIKKGYPICDINNVFSNCNDEKLKLNYNKIVTKYKSFKILDCEERLKFKNKESKIISNYYSEKKTRIGDNKFCFHCKNNSNYVQELECECNEEVKNQEIFRNSKNKKNGSLLDTYNQSLLSNNFIGSVEDAQQLLEIYKSNLFHFSFHQHLVKKTLTLKNTKFIKKNFTKINIYFDFKNIDFKTPYINQFFNLNLFEIKNELKLTFIDDLQKELTSSINKYIKNVGIAKNFKDKIDLQKTDISLEEITILEKFSIAMNFYNKEYFYLAMKKFQEILKINKLQIETPIFCYHFIAFCHLFIGEYFEASFYVKKGIDISSINGLAFCYKYFLSFLFFLERLVGTYNQNIFVEIFEWYLESKYKIFYEKKNKWILKDCQGIGNLENESLFVEKSAVECSEMTKKNFLVENTNKNVDEKILNAEITEYHSNKNFKVKKTSNFSFSKKENKKLKNNNDKQHFVDKNLNSEKNDLIFKNSKKKNKIIKSETLASQSTILNTKNLEMESKALEFKYHIDNQEIKNKKIENKEKNCIIKTKEAGKFHILQENDLKVKSIEDAYNQNIPAIYCKTINMKYIINRALCNQFNIIRELRLFNSKKKHIEFEKSINEVFEQYPDFSFVSIYPYNKKICVCLLEINKIVVLDDTNFFGIMNSFKSIISRNKETLKMRIECENDKIEWWKIRIGLDKELKELIHSIDDAIHIYFEIEMERNFFEPENFNTEEIVFKKITNNNKKISPDMKNKENFNNKPTNNINIFNNQNRKESIKNENIKETNKSNKKLEFLLKKNVFLILDEQTTEFPFDMLEIFTNKSVYRVPSLEYLIEKGIKSNRVVEISELSYILDAENNLENTRKTFEDFLSKTEFKEKIKLTGVTGKKLSDTDWEEIVSKPLFLYFGHGTGEKYHKKSLATIKNNAIAFIFGCSSSKLLSAVNFKRNGVVLKYLECNRNYLGCLWDTTDKDLDIFSKDFLTKLLSKNKYETKDIDCGCKKGVKLNNLVRCIKNNSHHAENKILKYIDTIDSNADIASFISSSRNKMRLKYLNGAAIVLWGLPSILKLKPKETH